MKALRRILAVTSAAALVTIAGPAWAAGPYTITAGTTSGGDVAYTAATTGASPQIAFNTPNVAMTCASGTAAGLLHTGSSPDGVNIASIDSTTWTDCVGPLGLPMTFTQTGNWSVDATGIPTARVTPVTMDGVAIHVEATSNPDTCRFDLTGSLHGNFNESDQTLNIIEDPELTPGANLTISEVVGCFGLWNNGEDATFRMSYALSNAAGPIAITQP